MSVAWAAVRARLATDLPAVVGSGVRVYDGPVVSNESPIAYLTIASRTSGETSGTFSQDVGPDGFSALEVGSVACELAVLDGSTAVPSAFDTFDAIATYLQADQTLGGVLTPGSTVTASADVEQSQTTSGAVQRLLIAISYTTRLP